MDPHDPAGGAPPPDAGEGEVHDLVVRQEVADLRAAREDALRRERRHWAVAVFGVSPSVVAVLLGLLWTGSIVAIIVFTFIVMMVEGWRASRAGGEARELADRIEELESELGRLRGG